jgi:ribonuclease HI
MSLKTENGPATGDIDDGPSVAERKQVEIFTDGACTGNPGPGGYGVILAYGEKRRELSGGYRLTTNNRMEIMAAIAGLEALRYPCKVTLYSDSQYLVNGIVKGWAKRWRANGWMRNKDEAAVNPDLWGRLLDLCAIHDVAFSWVRGHDGHVENERCDRLSVGAAAGKDLPVDSGYGGKGG